MSEQCQKSQNSSEESGIVSAAKVGAKALSSCEKDGSSSLTKKSKLSQRNDIDVFKTPELIPSAKKKRKVLEEDKFAEEIEKIIQRDFFPELEKLQAQNAYLNAVDNNDIHMLRELYSKYSHGKRTPRTSRGLETPSTFETPSEFGGTASRSNTFTPDPEATPTHLPMESPFESEESKKDSEKTKPKQKNISLNDFLDSYTSEDNQSFQDIMEESNKKHRVKYAWLFEAEQKHEENMSRALALPSIEEQADVFKKPTNVDTWTYKNMNSVMYVPDGAPYTAEELLRLAKMKTEVIHSNTRFKENPFKNVATPVESEGSEKTAAIFKGEGKIGIDGREVEKGTPKINGHSLVRTPSPTPGVEESPFMTWGEIEGTPFRLDGSDTPFTPASTAPYKMHEQSKREKIALELAEKVSQRYRDKKAKAIEAARSHLATPSPRPKSSLERLSSMSPAARRLAASHLNSRITDNALKASYTPKRISTPKTPSLSSRSIKTPQLKTPASLSGSSTPAKPGETLTDNLLNLPKSTQSSSSKWPTASDFFDI